MCGNNGSKVKDDSQPSGQKSRRQRKLKPDPKQAEQKSVTENKEKSNQQPHQPNPTSNEEPNSQNIESPKQPNPEIKQDTEQPNDESNHVQSKENGKENDKDKQELEDKDKPEDSNHETESQQEKHESAPVSDESNEKEKLSSNEQECHKQEVNQEEKTNETQIEAKNDQDNIIHNKSIGEHFESYFFSHLQSSDKKYHSFMLDICANADFIPYFDRILAHVNECKATTNTFVEKLIMLIAEKCNDQEKLTEFIKNILNQLQNVESSDVVDPDPISSSFFKSFIHTIESLFKRFEIEDPTRKEIVQKVIEILFSLDNRIVLTKTPRNFIKKHLNQEIDATQIKKLIPKTLPNINTRKGLVNQGCTCYLNSVIQQIFYTPDVQNILFTYLKDDRDISALQYLMLKLAFGSDQDVTTKNFTKHYKFQDEDIDPHYQCDANEFFGDIASKLYMEFKDARDIFQFNIKIESRNAKTDELLFTTDDMQFYLNLDLNGPKNVEESLEKLKERNQIPFTYNDEEIMIYRTRTIETLPRYLVVHVQRFRIDQHGRSHIITSKYDFNEKLSINGHDFELCGVIVHTGSLDGGHYYSYRLVDGQWYKFNDSSVTDVNYDKMYQDASGEGYSHATMLFYRNLSYPICKPKISKALIKEYKIKIHAVNLSYKMDDDILDKLKKILN